MTEERGSFPGGMLAAGAVLVAEPGDSSQWGIVNLIEGSALLPREIDAPDRFQQAHATVSHSTNARVRSWRW